MIELRNQRFINLSKFGLGVDGDSFSPEQISGNVFYFDAQDSTKVTDVGSGVISELIDKTNSSLKCTQTTDTKRAVRTVNVLNGKYGLSFDGINDFYTGPAIMTPAFTKWITFRVLDFETGGTTNFYDLISSNTSLGHALSFFLVGTTMRIRDAFAGNMAYDIPAINSNGVFTFIRTVESGNQKFYINGLLVAEQTAVYSNAVTGFNLGSFNNGAANHFFKGYIGDLGLVDRAMSGGGVSIGSLATGEIAQLDRHQKNKYRRIVSNPIKIATLGQSNAVGYATVKSDNNTPFIALDYISTYRHYRDLKDSTGDGYSAASIGSVNPPLVNKLNTLSGRTVLLVSTGKTATAISSVDSGGDTSISWGSEGTLRTVALQKIQEMLSQVPGSLDWIEINQGEKSVSYMAANPSFTKAMYKAAYLDLINWCKTNFSGVKILIVQTVQGRTAGDLPQDTTQWTAITEAQQELEVSEDNVFIDQSNVGFTMGNGNMEADRIHYTKAGNLVVGESSGTIIYNNL